MTLISTARHRALIPETCDACIRPRSSAIIVRSHYILVFDHSPCTIPQEAPCETCEGSGYNPPDPCPNCAGGGGVTRTDNRHTPCVAETSEYHEKCWEKLQDATEEGHEDEAVGGGVRD